MLAQLTKLFKTTGLLCLCLLSGGPGTSLAGGPVSLELLGALDRDAYRDLVQAGDYLICATDWGLAVRDLTAADILPTVHRDWTGRGGGSALVLIGDYLYCRARFGELMAFDVSNPPDPVLVYRSGRPASWGYPGLAALSNATGDYLAESTPTGFRIYDLHDYQAPVEIATLSLASGTFDIVTQGELLYTSDSTALYAYDLSDANHPALLAQLPIASAYRSLLFRNGFIFGASGGSGIGVVDARVPSALVLVDEFDLGDPVKDIAASSGMLYAIAGDRLWIVDPSNPAALTADSTEYAGAIGVTSIGAQLYLRDTLGLRQFEVTDPAAPKLTKAVKPVSWNTAPASNIEVVGDRAFVGTSADGLRAIDVSRPVQPGVAAELLIQNPVWATAATDSFVFAAVPFQGLYSVDVSRGDTLVLLDSLKGSPPTTILSIRLVQGKALLVDPYGVWTADLSDPRSLAITNVLNIETEAVAGISIAGDRGFLLSANLREIVALDISDVSNPLEIARYTDAATPYHDIKVSGDRAFIGSNNPGLQILDIHDLTRIVPIGAYSLENSAYQFVTNLTVAGDYALLSVSRLGLEVVDASDPAFPVRADIVRGLENIQDVAVVDSLVYVCTESNFLVFKMGSIQYSSGDVNNDGSITMTDIIYLADYVFRRGPEPLPVRASGDVDCDGGVSLLDIVHLVNYVLRGGPKPVCN